VHVQLVIFTFAYWLCICHCVHTHKRTQVLIQ